MKGIVSWGTAAFVLVSGVNSARGQQEYRDADSALLLNEHEYRIKTLEKNAKDDQATIFALKKMVSSHAAAIEKFAAKFHAMESNALLASTHSGGTANRPSRDLTSSNAADTTIVNSWGIKTRTRELLFILSMLKSLLGQQLQHFFFFLKHKLLFCLFFHPHP